MPRPVGIGRSDVEKEADMAEIGRLHRMGFTYREIAAKTGISLPTIAKDLKAIKARYNEAHTLDRAAIIRERLDLLQDIKNEAFKAWERSKRDAIRRTTKKVPLREDDGGEGLKGSLKKKPPKRGKGRIPKEPSTDELKRMFVTELTEVREGRLPASEYMNIVLKTIEQERALLGLDEALKVDLTGVGSFWDALIVARQGSPVRGDDALEAEIVRVDHSATALPAHKNGDGK